MKIDRDMLTECKIIAKKRTINEVNIKYKVDKKTFAAKYFEQPTAQHITHIYMYVVNGKSQWWKLTN